MGATVDTLELFDALAREMNAHPERFEVLGDVDLDLGIVMHRPGGDAFGVRLTFEGLECTGVATMAPGEEHATECRLEGPVEAWEEMFADIRAHGRATGQHTINSLTLLGEQIHLRGDDPMGVDKFSRFNQSIQQFLDGAAHVGVPSPT